MRCEGGRNRSDDDDDGGPKLMPEVSIYAMLESRGNEQGEGEGEGEGEVEREIFIYGWINETTRGGGEREK